MHLIDRITSLATLLSLVFLTPAVGRALLSWWGKDRSRSDVSLYLATAISFAIAIVTLTSVYGAIWAIHPRSVAWFGWMDSDLPIAGEVQIGGDVEVTGRVDIDNEPITVQIQR